jgi:hypothetical protein
MKGLKIIKEAIIFIVKFTFTLGLIGVFGYGALIGFAMAVCTGGGALVILLPILIVGAPICVAIIKMIWKDRSPKHTTLEDNKKMTKNEMTLVNYVVSARETSVSDSEIKKQLLAAGWVSDEIDKALKVAPRNS